MQNKKFGVKIRKLTVKILGEMGIKDKVIGPPSPENNQPFVYYAYLTNIEPISDISGEKGLEIPNSLIIKPGKFNFYGKTFDLKKEGLYRFIFPFKENLQRIVYEKNIEALLSSIAWIYSHGNSDDVKKFSEIASKALHSKIFATCGPISEWTHQLLLENGIKSRIISSITLDFWKSYENSHIMIEVFRPDFNKWVAYDLDYNSYFVKNNIPLSFIEFSELVQEDDYEIKYLAKNVGVDISNFRDIKNNFDYAFIMEARLVDENARRKWYKRVIQVPLISDGKYNYFFNNKNIKHVESYSIYYKYLEEENFRKKFYSVIPTKT